MKKLFHHRNKPYEQDSYEEEWEDEEYASEDETYDSEVDVLEESDEDFYAEEETEEFYAAEELDAGIVYKDAEFESEVLRNKDALLEQDERSLIEDQVLEAEHTSEEETCFDEVTYEEISYHEEEEETEIIGYETMEASGLEETQYMQEELNQDYNNEEEDSDSEPVRTVRNMSDYEDALLSAEEKEALLSKPVKKKGRTRKNYLKAAWEGFLNMGTMDRIILSTGVAVLVLAMVTGSVYASAKLLDKQVSSFVDVGKQLAGIELIGQTGLLAVADAEQAKIAAANAVLEEHAQISDEKKEYKEEEYTKNVTVALNMTSIQKDLKIKFVNKETGKLIANVPFKVTITDPDGKASTWEDDDMDGIIYKKGIAPGKYKVAITSLSEEKYKDITIPEQQESVEVKKDIEYKKVDVKNEIKSESEVNVSKEDTKINDTKVENKLNDTVTWVDSTSTNSNYVEIEKGKVPDPTTLAFSGSFQRLAYTGTINPVSKTLNVGESFTAVASSTGVTLKNITWSSSNTEVATVDSNGKVTAVAAGTAVISYQASGSAVSGNEAVSGITGSCSVTVKAALGKGTITAEQSAPVLAVNAKSVVKTTAAGFTEGKELTYHVVSSNTEVAAASVDANGNITITALKAGDASLTLTANYKEGTADTAATAIITVKVTANKVMTLDKTAATVYIGKPVTINATITNATASDITVSATSSDTEVATVTVSGKAITITGVNTGSATVTVTYTENGEEVKASCAVTIKPNPKEDRTSKLKDADGNQIYVYQDNVYREAVYADYYTETKFYVKKGLKYTGWQTLDGSVYYFDKDGNKVTGEQVIQGAKYNFASDGALVTGSGTRGIDVSKWNGSIDWKAVKNSGIDYVIIRCGYRGSSQGALIQDPKYTANIKGAIAANLKVGVYFFTQAVDEAEAVEEASMVLELVKNYKISYPIFLDVEGSGGRGDKIDKATRTSVIKAFCNTIQEAGYTAGVYANKSWLTNKIDASQLNAYKIWLAQYASKPSYKGRYDLWQYQSTGRVSGISGNVDMNWSYLGY